MFFLTWFCYFKFWRYLDPWCYSTIFVFLVGVGTSLGFVRTLFGANYFAAEVSGGFKVGLIRFLRILFFGILKASRLTHLTRMVSIRCTCSMLHLGWHHSFMSIFIFLFIKIYTLIYDLTLIMKKSLHGAIGYTFFIFMNGNIQKGFIVLYFWWPQVALQGLQCLIGPQWNCLVSSHLRDHRALVWELFMHLLILVHWIARVCENVLGWKWLLHIIAVFYWKSLVWGLLNVLNGTEIWWLNSVKTIIAIYRIIGVLNCVVVNWQPSLARANGWWHIQILMFAHRTVLLRKVFSMWFYHFASLFAHLSLTFFTLDHHLLLFLIVLILCIYHLIYLSATANGACLETLLGDICWMNIARW